MNKRNNKTSQTTSRVLKLDNIKSIFLAAILVVLVLILLSRQNNNQVNQNIYYLLMFIFIMSLASVLVKMIKSYTKDNEIQVSNARDDNYKINDGNELNKNINDITAQNANLDNSLVIGRKNTVVPDVGFYKKSKSSKRVRFNIPLKDYEIKDNYQKDFFTFRDTLYQNSSNDFDYADIMNEEHEAMDSKKPLKGKIWDLYDKLTKPDYSEIPVRYDANLNNATQYYPVSYKGPKVRLT